MRRIRRIRNRLEEAPANQQGGGVNDTYPISADTPLSI